jgi:para-nitrobenzyl esterase
MRPIAETTNGNVLGSLREGALVFLGIRYGASTGGRNRFLPPQPAAAWAGTIEAVAPGPSAPQLLKPENTDPFFSWYSAIRPISEDCLFLNVFTPNLHGKRPVMFWIHGGGWREYSGTAPGFDGTRLAASQDVVVITVNHRLNAFGFLTLDSGDDRFADSGNAGILDIIAALEWVRDNAEAFGGDPGNVTIFGESGGASKVAALMSVESAKGLFHKAIVQSSAGVRLASLDEAAKTCRSLAKALGRNRLDPIDMQALPLEAILNAMQSAASSYRGVIDGRTFVSDPFGISAPTTAAEIPVMIGCTNTEFTYYMRKDPQNFHLELPHVRQRLGRFFNVEDIAIDHLIRAYRAAEPCLDPSGLMSTIATDHIFKRSTYEIANHQAATARAPVYAYLFEWETPIEGGRMRSPHTCEVPFVFGTVDSASGCVGIGAELAGLSDTLMSVWATFARTGDPNISRLPHWQPYDPVSRNMMILNVESRLERDPGAAVRAELDVLPYFSHRNPMMALTGDMVN